METKPYICSKRLQQNSSIKRVIKDYLSPEYINIFDLRVSLLGYSCIVLARFRKRQSRFSLSKIAVLSETGTTPFSYLRILESDYSSIDIDRAGLAGLTNVNEILKGNKKFGLIHFLNISVIKVFYCLKNLGLILMLSFLIFHAIYFSFNLFDYESRIDC